MMIKSLEAVFCYIGYNNLIKVVGATPVPGEHSEFSLSKLVCLSPSLNNFFFHLNTSRPKKIHHLRLHHQRGEEKKHIGELR